MASDRALNIAELSVSHRDDHLGWGASISVINESVEYIQDKSIKEAIQDVVQRGGRLGGLMSWAN
jgi:hypothetical protein